MTDAPRLSDPAASRAVLIGTHTYRSLEDIPAARHNVTRLGELVRDPELWGLPPDRCTELLQPTRDQVLDAVHEAATGTSDTLLLYFAGHGLTDPYTGELYLAPYDCEPGRLDKALRYEDVRRLLLNAQLTGAVRPRRKVLVLDCCWSGLALGGAMAGRGPDVGTRADIEGTFVLTATAETRQALAPPGERHTLFTGELIEAVDRGIPGGPELLSMSRLYDHLAASLAAKSQPVPQQRNRNTASHISLFRNRAYRPVEPERPGEGQSSGEAHGPGHAAGNARGDGGVFVAAAPDVHWRRAVLLVLLPLLAVFTTTTLPLWWGDAFGGGTPLCAPGELRLTGTTAFEPVLREAATAYEQSCAAADVRVDARGGAAVHELGTAASAPPPDAPQVIAFSNTYTEKYPRLLPSALGFSVFTFYVNEKVADAGVTGLSTSQIRRIHQGGVSRWAELGGPAEPLVLVNRPPRSDSASTLRSRILGEDPAPSNSSDCARAQPETGPVICEGQTLAQTLDTVAATPGALGYGPVEQVSQEAGVRMLDIDGHRASDEATEYGSYKFWATTYAYTYRQPPDDSVAAGFLRFLGSDKGMDIMSRAAVRPCSRFPGATLPCRYR